MSGTALKVEFRDNDQVKALGARFDRGQKRWYVPEGKDLAPFARWLAEAPPADVAGELVGDTTPAKGVRLSSLLGDIALTVTDRFRLPVWVTAEVVRVDVRPNGVVILELRDGSAKANAFIWSNAAQRIVPRFQKATGMELGPNLKLLLQIQVRFTADHGLSLVVQDIDPDYSLGDLEAKKREILRILKLEGVLDRNRELPSPWDFQAVLVVAPPGAAGLGDFLAESDRLAAAGVCQFRVVHARFQGEAAPAEIRASLAAALADWDGPGPDAVIVIRGGGAVNDLAWLNDLALTRYLATLPIPVITGIGHERNRTTIDEVAHQCCDTPSKAIAHIIEIIRTRVNEARGAAAEVRELARRAVNRHRERVAVQRSTLELGARQHISQSRATASRVVDGVRTEARSTIQSARAAAREAIGATRDCARAAVRETRRCAQEALVTACEQPSRILLRLRGDAQSAIGEICGQVGARARGMRSVVQASLQEISNLVTTQVREARRSTRRDLSNIQDSAPRRVARLRELVRSAGEQIASSALGVVREVRAIAHANCDTVIALAGEHIHRARTHSTAYFREAIAMGPQKTLRRGFSVVRGRDGKPITRATGLAPLTPLQLEFQDGAIDAVTASTQSKKETP